ncbi:WW domain protein [Paecilomyces variotii No. 5]|uniref:WW domain protein n=1 Tax=Byssochlamys spectabilis (strain No. 5 / NBRC 109023) TaxID=1356009 RepID=V5FAR0_BYSSN|nr:WW domain protein [Paecilomyces variotii No. 5]
MSVTGGHHGRPDDELFLGSSSGPGTPNVEPLRISKRDNSSSPSSGAAQQPGATTVYSHNPLPYPDDRPQPQQMRPGSSSPQAPYPDDGRAGTPHSADIRPTDYPAALRPRDGRDSKPATLAERRGTVPKPLPDSPGPDTPEKEDLFQRNPQRAPVAPGSGAQPDVSSYPAYTRQYFPPPGASGNAQGNLRPTNPSSINRLSSTASTSTTRAQRGSPPPPETPVVGPEQQPGNDIEARYAAAGIAGTSTLSSLQAQNAAAQRRAEQYGGQQQMVPQAVQRPWTPTELPGSQPHGPPMVYQGPSQVNSPHAVSSPPPTQPVHPVQSAGSPQPSRIPPNALEQDFQRMSISHSPPPAYSSVPGANTTHAYPNDKQRPESVQSAQPVGHPALASPGPSGPPVAASTPAPPTQSHPAYANDPRQQQPATSPQQSVQNGQHGPQQAQTNASPAPSGIPPASPPPLPEGWIAHLDQNSGQYYYIHLPTQSTQWEFPKGPTPLNLNEAPLSPVGSVYGGHALTSPGLSTFGGKPLASPGMPLTPGYEASAMSLNSPAGGFTGPPPTSGVDLYRVAPTNGVYFGPYLRYTNMDLERGLWLGSILLVTDAPQPPTIHIHQSVDLSPNPRQLKPAKIAVHQRWAFYKYEVDLKMEESGPAKWTYAVTSHLGCTRYEFLVAGRHETNWRFIATSGNDFGLNVNANERSRLGGVGFMWKDIMQKHGEIGGFHAQLGLGGQIFADRIWKELPSLKQWLAMRGKEARKNAAWTAAHEEDVSHAYFHYYTSHFDQPYLREAFAQIPHIMQIDDHDIFDGFGSYPEYMQFSNMFKNIGRISIEMYLLFQHHTTLEILRNVSNDIDLFTITGTGWHFIKYLGPAVVVVGPDCRSERNPHQVLAGPTYQGLFPKVATLPASVQHCIWMISVPLIYPRLETVEQVASTFATGKKAVTGAYNVLGKVTSSVAGVVGAKEAVGSGFESIKRAVGKTGLMGGILNPFGDIEFLDELRDQWTHDSKDLERTYLIRTLQGIAKQKGIRMTFASGAVNACGAGLLHDPTRPSDHKTMYQLISSPVVNVAQSSYIIKMLHNNKPLYVPANGHRSTPSEPTDTKEDMLEIFKMDVNGQPREHRRLMGRRNYVAIVAYDPEVVNATYGPTDMGRGGGKLNLAADFMVQGDGAYANVIKYGPVVVPSLEFGR